MLAFQITSVLSLTTFFVGINSKPVVGYDHAQPSAELSSRSTTTVAGTAYRSCPVTQPPENLLCRRRHIRARPAPMASGSAAKNCGFNYPPTEHGSLYRITNQATPLSGRRSNGGGRATTGARSTSPSCGSPVGGWTPQLRRLQQTTMSTPPGWAITRP
jgi:hypothetical protein